MSWVTSRTTLLALGLVFHLTFILTVFDCYFTSPVVNGMKQFRVGDEGGQAPAKRVVLIVGDGLRADLLFNLYPFPTIPTSPAVVAPFLRDAAEFRGAFGISHTRVPTESRPGHVAIIGGMYEDVSAVSKGWKTNPVDFDSVFNQSSSTFSFGSPDILNMFSKGEMAGRVKAFTYDEEDEDFTKDATALDLWVLDQLSQLLSNATQEPGGTLDKELRADGVVIFLHLLGLDTTGHAYRPHSYEYMNNIRVVDSIVNKTESLLQDFYKDDGQTSFVFTADHGMSNIGNHGDGNPLNTRTPLVMWGAGIRGPIHESMHRVPTHDEYSKPWGPLLTSLVRRDVEQADLAPLMATLLGINLPVNSVGVLPDADTEKVGFLSDEQWAAKASVVNAKAILEHYRVKHYLKRDQSIFYTAFEHALLHPTETEVPGSAAISHLESLLLREKWLQAKNESFRLMNVTLNALRYIETYHRTVLSTIVVLGYTGWAAYAASSFLPPPSSNPVLQTAVTTFFTATFALSSALFYKQGSPWRFSLYVAFPCFFWWAVGMNLLPSLSDWWKDNGKRAEKANEASARGSLVNWGLSTLCAVLSLEAMVVAYTHRSVWTLGFLTMATLWPLTSWPKAVWKSHPFLWIRWAGCCTLASVFPLRDVEQRESVWGVLGGGVMMLVAGFGGAVYLMAKEKAERKPERDGEVWKILRVQVSILGFTMFVTSDSIVRLQAKTGLPFVNQALGWILFGASVLYPLTVRKSWRHLSPDAKLMVLFLAFGPTFVLLSICGEGMFYVAFCATVRAWVDVEGVIRAERKGTKRNENYKPHPSDLRIALFFLFFIQVAFFGTGNAASIASFYLEPVYRLVPVFRPFLMGALLLFKILAPYVFLAAAFARLTKVLGLPPFSLFMVALCLTDVMTITFFLRVTDTGSWLEIGQSLSFFVIASVLLVFAGGVCALGEWIL